MTRQVLSRLNGAAHMISLGMDGEKEKVSVFSGHDTVIAPVLSALGVYSRENAALCKWPHYASRIVFELYRNEKLQNTNLKVNRKRFRQLDKESDINSGELKGFGVRVLYNGLDITRLIPSCGTEKVSPLCSLTALNRQIDKIISPHNTFADACRIPQI